MTTHLIVFYIILFDALQKGFQNRPCLAEHKKMGVRTEWYLLKQFHKYIKYNWPRKHTEKHGKINCLTGNVSVSFRVFPWQGS
jgi:hypothetical protein